MRVCLAALYYAPSLATETPEGYLTRLPIMRHLPQALAANGHEVHVVVLFPREATWTEGDVQYHFVSGGARGRGGWARLLPPRRAIRRIGQLAPDVIHFHGLILAVPLFWLSLYLGRHGPPIIGHYHGGFPSRKPLLRPLQAFSLRRLGRALFTTVAHAQPFFEAGFLHPCQVEELMEVSTAFRRQPRAAAQALTGMTGSPVFLWAGRLHPVKDPLTALRGFARIQAVWTDAHLYLTYLTDELLPEMQRFLDEHPALAAHVHFWGRRPHAEMEALFNSADFFLQASRREYGGYAALEAMACGAIPVVTDIPSFRQMTGNGRYGILFPPGDRDTLARRVLAVEPGAIPALATAVQERFDREFSYPAMARRLLAIYDKVLEEQKSGRGECSGGA